MLYRDGLKEMFQLRGEEPASRFVDVQYKDLLADPLVQYRRVLTELGLCLTAEDEKAGAAWMAANGRETHPRHRYTPEDFGTTHEELVNEFKFYSDVFLSPR